MLHAPPISEYDIWCNSLEKAMVHRNGCTDRGNVDTHPCQERDSYPRFLYSNGPRGMQLRKHGLLDRN